MLSPAQIEQRRQAGRASWRGIPPEERRQRMQRIGRLGGRPSFFESVEKARKAMQGKQGKPSRDRKSSLQSAGLLSVEDFEGKGVVPRGTGKNQGPGVGPGP